MDLVLRDKKSENRIVAWIVGYSEAEISWLLRKNPSWYRSIA